MADKQKAGLDVETIITRAISAERLFFDKQIPYLKETTHYRRVTDEEADQHLSDLLNDSELIATPRKNIREALQRMSGLRRLQMHLDSDADKRRYLVRVHNGIFDVRTGRLAEDIKCKFTSCLNFEYSDDASLEKAPNFARFLETSVGKENQECFMRSEGFLLSNLDDVKKAVFFIGDGNTGKSMILDLNETVIGSDFVSSEPFEKLGNEQSRFKFIGKLLNISRETNRAVLSNEAAFKSLVSNERISGRQLYCNSVDYVPNIRLVIASNHPLEFSKPDDALIDRMVVVFFRNRLKPGELDHDLKSKLWAERNVIFSLTLKALHDLYRSSYDFKMSAESVNYLQSCRMQLHTAEDFIAECCEIKDDAVVSSADLLQAYARFCAVNGLTPVGRNTLFQQVLWHSANIQHKKIKSNGRYLQGFAGIGLKQMTNIEE